MQVKRGWGRERSGENEYLSVCVQVEKGYIGVHGEDGWMNLDAIRWSNDH